MTDLVDEFIPIKKNIQIKKIKNLYIFLREGNNILFNVK